MNPGLAQILTIVHSTDVADIENVTCIESVDVSCHHSAETWANCGFGGRSTTPRCRGFSNWAPGCSRTACG